MAGANREHGGAGYGPRGRLLGGGNCELARHRCLSTGQHSKFGGRAATIDDFNLFADLLLNWVGDQAAAKAHAKLAEAHAKIAENIRVTNAFNLDRRQAVIAAISLVNDALKAA